MSAAAGAITTLVGASPWNTSLALTWLSGSTYGRTLDQLVPVLVCLAARLPLALAGARGLDPVALDEDVPRVLGASLDRLWLGYLVLARCSRRTVIAPSQLAAGLVTALVGAPYFVWLLWRTRAVR